MPSMSNPRKRAVTPQDPRLSQLQGMRDRGMSQAEMARAIGASQQTVSRLLHYLDSLSSDQSARVTRERGPNALAALIAAENRRRAIRDDIYEAYHNGDMAAVDALWKLVSTT